MMKRRYIATAIVAALTLTAASAQSVQRLSATKANEYGISYTLPTTAVDVTLEVEITRTTPGEFCKYASKYLNVANPIMTPQVSARLTSAVITTAGVPDPDRRYMVTLKGGQSPYIVLTADNIPLSLNTEKTFAQAKPEMPVSRAASKTPLESDAARQVVTQEMLQSHSSAMRAKLAADQIYELRQTRTDLITGQADQMPPDGAALRLILDNIDAREAALMAMFVGTTSTSTEVKTVRVVPHTDINADVIARVSAAGILAPTDLSGAPVYLSLKVLQQGEMPVNEKGVQLPFPKGGIAYCIPGKAEVTVSFDGRTVAKSDIDMAQFGVVYGMNPANFTDKREPIYLMFDPATGAAAEVGPANR